MRSSTQDHRRAVAVSALVPNLEELRAALAANSDGALVAAAFDRDDLTAARSALLALVTGWEQAASSDTGVTQAEKA